MMKPLVLSFGIAIAAQAALAQGWGQAFSPERPRGEEDPQGEVKSLAEIKRIVERRYGGYLRREPVRSGNTYVLDWVDRDGNVLVITVDAVTGNILSARKG